MHSAPIHVRRATVNEAPIVIDLAQRLFIELGGFQIGEQAALVAQGSSYHLRLPLA